MRQWIALALALATGCEKTDNKYCNLHGAENPMACPDGGTTPVDTLIDTPPGTTCFGPASNPNFQVCLPTGDVPTGSMVLPPSINTGPGGGDCLDAAHQPAGWTGARDACFFVAGSITSTTAATQVSGTRPLVVLAATTIEISKALDASSHRNAIHGPGANSALCTGGLAGGTTTGALPMDIVGGGGGGGSYQNVGGAGGSASDATSTAAAGAASNPVPFGILAGGCGGFAGGGPASAAGAPGAGGGAVYLVAGESITISSTINASGAGGFGGSNQSGGSGGGSGGMIAIFAPSIVTTAMANIFASGGGGAGGGDTGTNAGQSGEDASAALTQPIGGAMGSGGDGGKGFGNNLPASAGLTVAAGKGGGGGGGGGAGFVVSNKPLGATVSPALRNF